MKWGAEINPSINILVVDPDKLNRDNLGLLLKREGFRVHLCTSGGKGLALLAHQSYHLLLTGLQAGDMDGIRLMIEAKRLSPDIEVIFVSEGVTVDSAVGAMQAGAFSCLDRPFSIEHLLTLVRQALAKTMARRAIRKKQRELRNKKGIQFIGRNPAIVQLKSDIAEFAQLDCNILITGETGTGKELVASTIHALSRRADRRFLPINCSALNEELMLNELFGHEREAFTGASKFRSGLFESADKGTMLLDEIGEMPVTMQAKLLRVLQEKRIIRVGGTREIPVDVRILAATNRNLRREVKRGRFRQDLFYRINVVSVHIPPLRKRRDDIPLLIDHFLAKNTPSKHQTATISAEAREILLNYEYPGNVRELENIIERSIAVSRGHEIQPHHLPPEVTSVRTIRRPVHTRTPLLRSLKEHERDHILSVLTAVNGNRTRAAEILAIDRVSLWRKLKRYQAEGIEVPAPASG